MLCHRRTYDIGDQCLSVDKVLVGACDAPQLSQIDDTRRSLSRRLQVRGFLLLFAQKKPLSFHWALSSTSHIHFFYQWCETSLLDLTIVLVHHINFDSLSVYMRCAGCSLSR